MSGIQIFHKTKDFSLEVSRDDFQNANCLLGYLSGKWDTFLSYEDLHFQWESRDNTFAIDCFAYEMPHRTNKKDMGLYPIFWEFSAKYSNIEDFDFELFDVSHTIYTDCNTLDNWHSIEEVIQGMDNYLGSSGTIDTSNPDFYRHLGQLIVEKEILSSPDYLLKVLDYEKIGEDYGKEWLIFQDGKHVFLK